MTLDDLDRLALAPALSLLPAQMDSPRARAMLCAIALQESGLQYRAQIGGPARGWLQFEPIGIDGVLQHHSSADLAHGVCHTLGYRAEAGELIAAIEHNDVLAVCFARLLLWRLPDDLPTTEAQAWAQYVSTWRPGKPHETRWHANWRRGIEHYEGADYGHTV